MSGSHAKERAVVVAHAIAKGWSVAEKENKNGYLHIKCPCKRHQKWLRKTPSDPNHWKNTIAWIDRSCPESKP